ncbi:MAG TPA: DNA mismatch repair endonuclease MutL [Candidatus Binatia bacterium]|nr:DNA mismatch repair endonuclease MutL [Candidatus Binatia bacterium]
MTRIRRLPEHVVNQIAAGEVVERPGSVVKELVENAIDAESTQVTVELGDGGRQLVRVTDDGIGMTADEVELALARHATSKIATEADLAAISTFGFRGEALPAICAVARFSLRSCPRGGATGTLLRGEGGVVNDRATAPAAAGTQIEVRDLFYNTPARLKFLRGARAELGGALRLLAQIALAVPAVHLHVTHEGRSVLLAPRSLTLRDRLGAQLGFELAGRMLEVDRAEQGIRVSGLVSPPALDRGNRDDVTFVVNGRPVRDTLLAQTLLEAYRPLLARDRFPVAVLRIDLARPDLDVNVHPTKAWVRFRSARLVQEAVYAAVQTALRAPGAMPRHGGPIAAAEDGSRLADRWMVAGGTAAEAGAPQATLFREEAAPFAGDRFGAVVGQLHDTFVVAANAEEVFFVDQHVAHERVLYERLRAELTRGPLPSQELLLPTPLELAPGQGERLEEWERDLLQLGFRLEGFGGGSILLRAVPDTLRARDPQRLVQRLVDEVGTPRDGAAVPVVDRLLAFVSCRAAIKAPAPLERAEMTRLLADLARTETPFFCPHGRPVVSRLSLREIRRELRRTW